MLKISKSHRVLGTVEFFSDGLLSSIDPPESQIAGSAQVRRACGGSGSAVVGGSRRIFGDRGVWLKIELR